MLEDLTLPIVTDANVVQGHSCSLKVIYYLSKPSLHQSPTSFSW